ncbi:MAG: C39 family peptidase [Elusimicrobia bacterium]|nr:C39 family peptidase [Elusimicrobiota bacterium]
MESGKHAAGVLAALFPLVVAASPEARAVTTIVHATPLDLEGSAVTGLKALPFERGLLEGAGTLESPALEAPAFDELVGSWSAELPPGAWIELSAQVRSRGAWSGWYRLGRWDEEGGRSLGEQADALGRVDVDTLKLARPADALRYRVELGQGREAPRLTRVAAALSSSTEAAPTSPPSPGPWVRELAVRPRSQLEEQEKYRHDICSPTSLAMVLDFWGRGLPTVRVAEAVRDRASQLFGNWPLNTAFAGRSGLRAHVARLSFRELERELAAGRPVIASITFAEGELPGAPIRRTKGHVVVVAGLTGDGDVVARDPAGKTRGEVRRVYRRADFEKAWGKNKRGLAYVVGPPFPVELAVGVSSADLRRKPRRPEAPEPDDPERASQVLYGERVRALRAKGDWVEVEALEQEAFLPLKRWHGYRGWVEARFLRWPVESGPATAVVSAKSVELRPGAGGPVRAPLGSRLVVESSEGSQARVRLVDGRVAAVAADSLRPLGGPPDRQRVLAAARRFLGDTYVWGGRSSVQPRPGWAVDCSGLAGLSYRAEGVDIPRDAHEQFLKAKPVQRAELRPGDLVFLGKAGSRKAVNHVMLFAGGDGLIESRESAARVLETTFRERFGRPLSQLESGDTVTDPTGAKPERRRLFFGSFLP